MDDSENQVEVRQVSRRGCGYPKPGGVYLESQGEAGGTLPIIVVIEPPIEHTHFHRGWVYYDKLSAGIRCLCVCNGPLNMFCCGKLTLS